MRRISPPACCAMRRLGLDRVWWLVTPGNPLKDTAACRRSRAHRGRARAGGPSAHRRHRRRGASARATPTTRSHLQGACPGVRFVWLMGADNLRNFHRWQHWREIADAGADRRDRSRGRSLSGAAGPARAGARALPAARARPRRSLAPTPARLGLPARPANRRCPRPPAGRAGPDKVGTGFRKGMRRKGVT